MDSPFLQTLKTTARRVSKYTLRQYKDAKNFIKAEISALRKPDSARGSHKNLLTEIIILIGERWKVLSTGLVIFLTLYYGLGAAISSKIDNTISTELSLHGHSRYTTAALVRVLKKQVDETPWTPALPIIFPAAVLDNLPNFQIGAKDSVRFFIKRLNIRNPDKHLRNAGELLSYPPHIWLFSRAGGDSFAPGSAKQYRKAIAELSSYDRPEHENTQPTDINDFIFSLESGIRLIEMQLDKLTKHIREHNGETLDFKADDVFFQTQGSIYALHYWLIGLSKDYQDLIVESGQYETLTAALKFIQDAEALDPISIKNAAPEDIYAANHLMYLSFYLSQAENRLRALTARLRELSK